MNIARFSVRQSLFVNLLSIFVIIGGISALFTLNKEAFPNVSFDTVTISTLYPAAPPEEIEKLVTVPIEKEIREVDGIKEILSNSFENMSYITVKIDPDAKDKDKVVTDIQRAVDGVKDLPLEAEKPLVYEASSKQIPIIEVALSADMPEKQLQTYADMLEDRFLDIKGVASVQKKGYRDKEIWVEVDPQKMESLRVSLEEIILALKRQNISIPAGKLTESEEEFHIRTTGEFRTLQEIEEVIIRANDAGNWLKIKDTACVRETFEEEDSINKCGGKRSISLVITKKEKGDTVIIVDKVREEIKNFLPAAEGLNINTVDDLSYFIRRRLNVLKSNGWMGIVLVIGSLFLFLNSRLAVMTALGIPFAFLAAFCVMLYLGMSINLISMFGLIVVLGMLVDDSIVIVENSFRYLEKGFSREEAAVKGTSEVIKPVAATVFTTMVAFTPLLFMPGIIGKFVKDIPIVVIIALSASMLEAFVVLPSHFADFAKIAKKKTSGLACAVKESRREIFRTRFYNNYLSFYTRILKASLKRRYLVISALTLSFAALLAAAFFVMKFVLFPGGGIEEFYIRAEAEEGTPLEVTAVLMEPYEKIVETLPKDELDSYVTQIGSTAGIKSIIDPHFKKGSNYAQMTVYLTAVSQRKRSAQEIIEDLKISAEKITGFKKVIFEELKDGPPTGAPVQVRIKGENFDVLEKISGRYIDYLNNIDGIRDVSHDYRSGKKEIRIMVDKEAAAAAGLTVGDIASTIRYALEGGVATSIKPTKAEEEIEVLVKFPLEYKDTLSVFDKIYIPNKMNNLIPLKRVARLDQMQGLEYIKHMDGKRVVTVTANVNEKKITSIKANSILQRYFKDIEKEYPGYYIDYGGEQEETMESLRGLFKAFGIAFLLIFLILATTFRSLWQPFIVLLTVPFGLMGVIIAFLIHDVPFSFMALMGIVGLIGVVVNDSIILVDFINKLRSEGIERRDSIVEAGRLRLRSITLTTITTVFGLMPVAYGIGGFDPFLKPMALAFSWGLLFSTALTLIIIPCVYAVLDDVKKKMMSFSMPFSLCKK